MAVSGNCYTEGPITISVVDKSGLHIREYHVEIGYQPNVGHVLLNVTKEMESSLSQQALAGLLADKTYLYYKHCLEHAVKTGDTTLLNAPEVSYEQIVSMYLAKNWQSP